LRLAVVAKLHCPSGDCLFPVGIFVIGQQLFDSPDVVFLYEVAGFHAVPFELPSDVAFDQLFLQVRFADRLQFQVVELELLLVYHSEMAELFLHFRAATGDEQVDEVRFEFCLEIFP
jgi:hypothetical protein